MSVAEPHAGDLQRTFHPTLQEPPQHQLGLVTRRTHLRLHCLKKGHGLWVLVGTDSAWLGWTVPQEKADWTHTAAQPHPHPAPCILSKAQNSSLEESSGRESACTWDPLCLFMLALLLRMYLSLSALPSEPG